MWELLQLLRIPDYLEIIVARCVPAGKRVMMTGVWTLDSGADEDLVLSPETDAPARW